MRKNLFATLIALFTITFNYSQNVAINASGAAPVASAMLDITSTTSGLLMPRMSTAQKLAIASPATGLKVYDTTTNTFWWFNGTVWVEQLGTVNGWALAGNALVGTEILGSTNAQPVRLFSNNTEWLRLTSAGQFVMNNAGVPFVSTAFSSFGTATYGFAILGNTTQNAAATYGYIPSGASQWGAVQGEYAGTNAAGAGAKGLLSTTTSGTSFNTTQCISGVTGAAQVAGNYKFGVFGTGGNSTRSGGVIGNNFATTWGALGYFTSGSANTSVYGFGTAFTTGGAGGKLNSLNITNEVLLNEPNSSIGLGIYGGVMGGWVKGLVYGTNFSGPKYGVYVDGKTITNNIIAQLYTVPNSDKRIATYATTSMEVDVYAKGKAQLINGKVLIKYDSDFKNIISENKDVIITLTPIGKSNGIFINNITRDGFEVEENNNGISSVWFNWIAIGTKKGYETPQISSEILDVNYDANMEGVMHNDIAPYDGLPIWWDGYKVRHDQPQIERIEKSEFKIKSLKNLAETNGK